MKENLKKRLDRVEDVTMPTKRKNIHEYSDEELEQIIADWEVEEGVAPQDKPLVIIQAARNRNQKR